MKNTEEKNIFVLGNILKFSILSMLGIFIFFIAIEFNGKTTIPLDHMVGFFKTNLSSVLPYYALIVIFLGAVYPFYKKEWNKDTVTIIFSIAKVIGFFVAVMAVTKIGPDFLFQKGMVPFLYDKLVISVGLIVPIGAIFLAFLINYGLLEFIGVLLQPVMKPIWKTPGRSAIDAVASFVGSYSIGLLITNRVYMEGKYSAKEAAIIATGFSTVSATFMIIVAKTLGLMEMWNFYFFSTLVITFMVTAITVRLYPLSKKSDLNYNNEKIIEIKQEGNIFKNALKEGLSGAAKAEPVLKNIGTNFVDGFKMTMAILPSILSIGLLGLLLAKYTPLFDIAAYIFYPFTYILQLPDPLVTAKAITLGIAEMFLPALASKEAVEIVRYVVGVVSISSILFFSASIPCIMSTSIPLSMKEIIIVWFQRTVLSLIIASGVAHIFL